MLGKAAAAAGKAASAAGKAAKAADDKLGVSQAAKAKGDAAKARVMAVPPEQRQQYLETASTVLSVASLLGGKKTGLAASAVGAAASLHTTQVPHAPQTTVVRVVATVPGGQEMTISIETGEMFRVMVPPGVQKGQEFEIEIPMPAGAGGASSSSAPGGGSAQSPSCTGGGRRRTQSSCTGAKQIIDTTNSPKYSSNAHKMRNQNLY